MADGASRCGGRDSPLMVWGELGLVKPEHDIIQDMPETDVVFCFRESPEGGFEARTISHSIFTQAKTVEELTANREGSDRLSLCRKEDIADESPREGDTQRFQVRFSEGRIYSSRRFQRSATQGN